MTGDEEKKTVDDSLDWMVGVKGMPSPKKNDQLKTINVRAFNRLKLMHHGVGKNGASSRDQSDLLWLCEELKDAWKLLTATVQAAQEKMDEDDSSAAKEENLPSD